MTKKQAQQFNWMRSTLKRIANKYGSSEQILRSADGHYGLDATECLSMAYDNIQQEARAAVKGVREIPLENDQHIDRHE